MQIEMTDFYSRLGTIALIMALPDVYKPETSLLFLSGLAAGFVIMFALIILSRIIFNPYFYKGELRYESQFALIFNNATFLGYPIISSTFGEQGVVPYCGFIIAFNIWLAATELHYERSKLYGQCYDGAFANLYWLHVIARECKEAHQEVALGFDGGNSASCWSSHDILSPHGVTFPKRGYYCLHTDSGASDGDKPRPLCGKIWR